MAPPPASAFRTLLAGAIDYAGLFPPAGLDLPTALANYQAYRSSADAWALGRFVVPLSRLGEVARLLAATDDSQPPLPLSVLLDSGSTEELRALETFRHQGSGAQVESLELKPGSHGVSGTALGAAVPDARWYLEVPADGTGDGALGALVAQGGLGKVRTGGTTTAAFPAPEHLLGWLATAARHRLGFKATAGLHHPLRGSYRLTYAENAPTGVMFGFLNLMLAAALLWRGNAPAEAKLALLEEDPKAFRLGTGSLVWRGLELNLSELAALRTRFFHGFGSCSFREPLDELAAWGWQ